MARSGLITPPCGVPLFRLTSVPFSDCAGVLSQRLTNVSYLDDITPSHPPPLQGLHHYYGLFCPCVFCVGTFTLVGSPLVALALVSKHKFSRSSLVEYWRRYLTTRFPESSFQTVRDLFESYGLPRVVHLCACEAFRLLDNEPVPVE